MLKVSNLAYAYPDGHQALYGVNLAIEQGERVAVLGPNGAGKTTLVLHLNGILEAGHGSVEVSGLPVAKPHLQEIRRRVGLVFKTPTTSCSCQPSPTMSPSARRTWVWRARS